MIFSGLRNRCLPRRAEHEDDPGNLLWSIGIDPNLKGVLAASQCEAGTLPDFEVADIDTMVAQIEHGLVDPTQALRLIVRPDLDTHRLWPGRTNVGLRGNRNPWIRRPVWMHQGWCAVGNPFLSGLPLRVVLPGGINDCDLPMERGHIKLDE